MDTKDSLPRLNAQILEEAAEWLVEFNTGTADSAVQQKFHSWLRTSPEHVRAYLEVVPIWEAGSALPLETDISAQAFIALGKNGFNIVPLGVPVGSPPSPHSSPRTRLDPVAVVSSDLQRRWFTLAASTLLVITLLASLAWFGLERDPTYSTEVGEQRSVALADGSMIELNARSRVRIRFTERERQVDLIEGQALFRVAKNPARPFVVVSGSTRVRAVGTQFDVYRKKSGTIVTVLEGRVAVVPAGPDGPGSGSPAGPENHPLLQGFSQDAQPLFVDAGEQVTVTTAAEAAAPTVSRAIHANVAAATAWTQRRLVFDASTLAEVAQEFNRYNTRQLVVRDTALETFPISGAFSSTDPASLVRFLQLQPGITVTMRDNEIEITASR